MGIRVKKNTVTTLVVDSPSDIEIKRKAKQLEEEGFNPINIRIAYKTDKEESKFYWFKAVKRVED